MSTQQTFSTEEERREAAELAGEPSDEELEASLREEAHHRRPTVYVPSGKAGEAQPASAAHGKGVEKGEAGGPTSKNSHQKHHPHRHTGNTPADIAQHDREMYGVRDTAKLDSVRRRWRGGRSSADAARSQATTSQSTASPTPARVRDSTMRS